jgi:plasmid stability protein
MTALKHEMRGDIMAILTVRNLPDEVHRALRLRAAQHGRSTEAEVRALLEEAVKPQGRLKLGSMLADIGRKVKLTDEEVALINQRDTSAPRAVDLE